MKEYRRKYAAFRDLTSSPSVRTARTASAQPNTSNPPRAEARLNRAQRRRNAVFNRRLEARLKKDGTPAKVEILPDGGIHVTADAKKLKQEENHAEEDTDEGEET
jgi:hypothetical protein